MLVFSGVTPKLNVNITLLKYNLEFKNLMSNQKDKGKNTIIVLDKGSLQKKQGERLKRHGGHVALGLVEEFQK